MNALMMAIFVALCVEVATLLLLVAPWPAGFLAPILRAVSGSKFLETVSKPALYFFALVLATWIFTTRRMLQLQSDYYTDKKGGDIGQKLLHEVLMFRSQRDFYLSGFAALLILVLNRIYLLVKETNSLKASTIALKRQAEQASAAYRSQLTEIDELKKSGAAPSSAAKSQRGEGGGPMDADAIEAAAKKAADDALASPKAAAAAGEGDGGFVAELKEECKRLRELLGLEREEGKTAVASAEAMRRQSENLSREYSKLMAQKESLENKLADFELVLGDTVKKAK